MGNGQFINANSDLLSDPDSEAAYDGGILDNSLHLRRSGGIRFKCGRSLDNQVFYLAL